MKSTLFSGRMFFKRGTFPLPFKWKREFLFQIWRGSFTSKRGSSGGGKTTGYSGKEANGNNNEKAVTAKCAEEEEERREEERTSLKNPHIYY